MIGAQQQAAAWRIRRRNRSRIFTGNLTVWSAGLVVAEGDYVQDQFGGVTAWQAQNSGVTSGTGPSIGEADNALYVDGGGVEWLHIPLLLVQPPTIG